MGTTLSVTSEAPVLPVTLEEAKLKLRIDGDALDDEITIQLGSATRWAAHGGIQLVQASFLQTMEAFPDDSRQSIHTWRVPLQSVESIQYVDENGVTQTWDASKYQVDSNGLNGRIKPVPDECYPQTRKDTFDAVQIRFTAGYAPDESGSPTDFRANIPAELKQAILLHVKAHHDAHPDQMEKQMLAARNLINLYRPMWFR